MITLEPILETSEQNKNHFAGKLAGRVSPATVIRHDEPLAKHTTLRVGGPADFFVEPADENDLAGAVKCCRELGIKFFILGRGSNLLVRDGGFRGVVICLLQPAFSKIEIIGQKIQCGAGAKLKAVAVEAKRNNLSGMEFLEGIPGTIGGALRMNAGAMDSQMFDIVELVRVMDFAGEMRELPPTEMSVKYRGCDTLKNQIALGAVLKGRTDSRESIEQRMIAFSKKRWASQPPASSAGCIFKNPTAIPAGKLVDELGLKRACVGGASISAEHGNFIVNDGEATARDVLELINLIKQHAKKKRGIELQTEVEIIGEE
jgi:UDP-N-acetylmuramate--alanine ligase